MASFTKGTTYDGFECTRVEELPNLRAEAREFRHTQSGAQLVHMFSKDNENCFAVLFPTPPPDNTGLPHILEHAVLGGSRKYPVREPFFEMVKLSTATFINAMTAQAYTVYPIATTVKKDFFNLAEVYADAVFHPSLEEATFRREGHHLALADNEDLSSDLKISGIVYNEMKGAYSSPESLMWVLAGRGLFPDTHLGHDSGGNPGAIPTLTFEQFKQFHQTLYHPSNARIFVYGDIETEEHLRFLNPILSDFCACEVRIPTPLQPRWDTPRSVDEPYPVGKGESLSARTFMALNWLVGDGMDPVNSIAWSVLYYLLVGNDAAPLKKAIIDSKLGEDLFFSGDSASAYETSFHVGIKGSESDRADAFEELVLSTLAEIANSDIPPDRVEAAFRQIAYRHLEVGTLFPMRVLSLVSASWPYNGDPLSFLHMPTHIEECQRRYASDDRFFNTMIREALLDNPHRIRVVLRPDPEMQARDDAEFADAMAKRRAGLSGEQIAEIARAAAELEKAQGEPNPPEALAKLPQLAIGDLPAEPVTIPTTIGSVANIPVLCNDVFTNGLVYMDVDIDLAGLPPDLCALLPRYCDAVSKMGAAGQSFAEIADRRTAFTGGLSCSVGVYKHAVDPANCLRRLHLGLRSVDATLREALDLLGDLVFRVEPGDRERLRDVLTQARAGYRTHLVNDGMSTARKQASRGFSPEAAFDYLFMSTDTLRRIEALTTNFDRDADELTGQIEQIRDFILDRRRWTISFTGSDDAFAALSSRLEAWTADMSASPVADIPYPFTPFDASPREGLAAPLKIAHCIKAMPAPHLGHPDVPLFGLGVYLSRFDYFLPEIRFKGNAYGAGASHDDSRGVFSLYSYRDPRIVETLKVFDGLRDVVHNAPWSQDDVNRAIIGSAKGILRPVRPGEATGQALARYIRGDTEELRRQRYEATLRATPKEIKRAFIGLLEENEPKASVCVIAGREMLEKANAGLGDSALEISDVLT